MNDRGFTLIEVIIYIGLFSILMTGSVVAAYQLVGSGAHNQRSVLTQEEGTFLNRKINWALTGASAVSVSGGNILTITRPDLGAQSPIIISGIISGSEGNITLTRNGSAPAMLNTESLSVNNVSFIVIPAALGRPTEVDVSFSIGTTPFIFKKYLRQ
ncbi:MAG: prepilin-type N-terminal cleavage/methylation domain-containing protein [bacterium]|nr:prepilin-type N-terminal cleavage/methylation domain-containing protein [bacterium]